MVNGLDLRRHSFIDVAAEEYSDKRVPSLGIRGSYRFQNDWELEGFVQRFRPSVFSSLDTPYNVIASQFVVHQEEGWDDHDDKFNFGARLTGRAGDFDLDGRMDLAVANAGNGTVSILLQQATRSNNSRAWFDFDSTPQALDFFTTAYEKELRKRREAAICDNELDIHGRRWATP